MTKSEQLRARAEECEAKAEAAHDHEVRWLYRDMAAQWRQLARQRDEFGLRDSGKLIAWARADGSTSR
jgi:hypothetical protein